MVADAQEQSAAIVKETSTQEFRQDVLVESTKQPVLVDFWAPWCGPCKQLTPVIERAVTAAEGRIKLVKMNIDAYPEIAGQLGVQSIPAVIAFQNGQPVDGFMGAVPESQIRGFIERLVGPLQESMDDLLEEAEVKFAHGNINGAAEILAAVLEKAPDNTHAIGSMARLHISLGNLEEAQKILDSSPVDKQTDNYIVVAQSALELARQAETLGDTHALEQCLIANPDDHQARFDLALALNSHHNREEALKHLLEIVRRDRTWNDDGARKQLVQFFEVWGPNDPMSVQGRRRLSSVLFA